MSQSHGISLKRFTMGGEKDGYHLLVRVVSVNSDDTLSLPVYELWAKHDAKHNDVEYMLYFANSSRVKGQREVTLIDADSSLRYSRGGPWIRTLSQVSRIGFGGYWRWFPTALVRAESSIWQLQKSHTMRGDTCYIVDEQNLKIWLELRDKKEGESADEFDSETNWDLADSSDAGDGVLMDDGGKALHDGKKDQDETMEDVDSMLDCKGGEAGEAVRSGPSANFQFSLALRSRTEEVIDEGYEADKEYGVTSMPFRGRPL